MSMRCGGARVRSGAAAALCCRPGAAPGARPRSNTASSSPGHTSLSPKDKNIVNEPGKKDTVWWGDINQPIEPARFENLQQRMLAYLQGKELFVQDLYAGADPEYRLPVRVISDGAWPSLFSRNMFIRPAPVELADFKPAF